MKEINSTSNQLTLLTVRQFSETYPAFSQGSLRNLIFNSKTRKTSRGDIPGNGLQEIGAIVNVGRKILLVPPLFLLWIELLNTGELSDVIDLINQKKCEGVYLNPEDAVKEIRYPEKSQQRIKAGRHV